MLQVIELDSTSDRNQHTDADAGPHVHMISNAQRRWGKLCAERMYSSIHRFSFWHVHHMMKTAGEKGREASNPPCFFTRTYPLHLSDGSSFRADHLRERKREGKAQHDTMNVDAMRGWAFA